MSNQSNEYTRYVIFLDMLPGKSFTEELIREHVKYLRKLESEGKLVLCGPFTDFRGGMVIINAASKEEAEQIALSDPFVSSGTETFNVRTWELSCEKNNHLGMG